MFEAVRRDVQRTHWDFTWRKTRLLRRLGESSATVEHWWSKRSAKQRRWLLEANESVPADQPLDPTPRTQIDHWRKWHDNHKPPFSEHVVIASRWTDKDALQIRLPRGLTEQQRREAETSIRGWLSLCNLKVVGDAPPKITEGPDS